MIGESGVERARVGLNRFTLEPVLHVRKGDHLGFFTDWPQPGIFPVQIDGCAAPSAGRLHMPGDSDGSAPVAGIAHDPVGRYAFRAGTIGAAGANDGAMRVDLLPGRRTYRLPITQEFAVGDQVELHVTVDPGVAATVRFRSPGGVRPEYAAGVGTSTTSRTEASPGWSFASLILLGLSVIGAGAIVKRSAGRGQVLGAGACPVGAALVWWVGMSAAPLAALTPAVVVLTVVQIVHVCGTIAEYRDTQ